MIDALDFPHHSQFMISIEPISRSHLPFVQRHASDPIISAASLVPYPYPDDGAARWYDVIHPKIEAGLAKVFAIKSNDDFCGVVSINQIDQQAGSGSVDYWVAVPFHGIGVGSGAVNLVLRHAHERLGLFKFNSACLLRNIASVRVLEKNGFKQKAQMILRDGRFKGETFCRFERPVADALTMTAL